MAWECKHVHMYEHVYLYACVYVHVSLPHVPSKLYSQYGNRLCLRRVSQWVFQKVIKGIFNWQ